MRLAWCTDLHFDVCRDAQSAVINWAEGVKSKSPDAVLITGDISVAQHLIYHLSIAEKVLQIPIYFVLGNHDFWGHRIESVQKQMKELSSISTYLKWIPDSSYIPLTQATCLIGHDGWYDALYGQLDRSFLTMNDWNNIHDYRDVGGASNRGSVIGLSRMLSHAAATMVQAQIKAAMRYHSNIFIATHVPPFHAPDADALGLPWYASKMMGDLLTVAAQSFPNVNFTVFSGHTHEERSIKVAKNLSCHTGKAEYGRPGVQSIIEVP